MSSVQEIRDIEAAGSNRFEHLEGRSMKVFKTEALNGELELSQRCRA
jgi:hypothetical protein